MSVNIGEYAWIPARVRRHLNTEEQTELDQLIPGTQPGEHVTLNPVQLLQTSHLLDDLEIYHPPVEAMVRRLLAVFTARTSGLDNRELRKWHQTRQDLLDQGRIPSRKVEEYFVKWRRRLQLFDEDHPWCQDPRLMTEMGAPARPARLDMSRPSGNRAVWTNRTPENQPVSVSDAIGWLLAWRGFGPTGLAGKRTHDNGIESRTNGTAYSGPFRGTVSYFPIGDTLFHSLLFSVPSPDTWPSGPGQDLALWEQDDLPNPLIPEKAEEKKKNKDNPKEPKNPVVPAGLMGMLMPKSTHALLLQPDPGESGVIGARIAWDSAGYSPAPWDPFLIMRSSGKPLSASMVKPAWRDLDKILNSEVETATGEKNFRPVAFNCIPQGQQFSVRIAGWDQHDQDKQSGYYSLTTPPVSHIMKERGTELHSRVTEYFKEFDKSEGWLRKTVMSSWGRKEGLDSIWRPLSVTLGHRAERGLWGCVNGEEDTESVRDIANGLFEEISNRFPKS